MSPIVVLVKRPDERPDGHAVEQHTSFPTRVAGLFMTDAVSAPARSGLLIDESRYVASLDGIALDLTPVEFRLLRILSGSPGRVFSRAQLLDHLYEDHRVVNDRAVDSHIKNLRRKLQRIRESELVESVYGVGYKLAV